MSGFAILFVLILFCGCGDASRDAPTLLLKIESSDGRMNSTGRHLVLGTGVLSESADSGSEGQGRTQRVTIEKITDHAVTLKFELSGGERGDFARGITVCPGQEVEVDLPNDSTLMVKLIEPD
jgi:hypothetical protein